MTKIKICGLSRPCDIEFVNAALPDFCGFIVDVPTSRRSISPEQVRALRAILRPEIQPVGVFVNAPQEEILSLVRDGSLKYVQLHGQEDSTYIAALRAKTDAPIIQAFRISSAEDVQRAESSCADHILLDSGSGSGKAFDWSCLQGITRPYMLAGGLSPDNLSNAVQLLHPWAVDLSSGVETDGVKDAKKILAAVQTVRQAS